MDGISEDQKTMLKKKVKQPFRSEADKWRDVYLVLFPDTPDANIPSPCKYGVQ